MSNPIIVLAAFGLLLFGREVQADPRNSTPLEVVKLRIQYYNDHNIEAMLALYGEDIAVYTYPDRLVGKGKQHLRRVLEEIFADKSVRVTLSVQVTKDSYVVNEERVTYAAGPTQYVSIYEIRDGLIRSVRFVRD